MTVDAADEIRDHVVCTLPPLTPGSGRAEGVRAMCRARLERDRRRSHRRAALSRFGRHVVAPALTAGLFARYATDVVSITLRTFSG